MQEKERKDTVSDTRETERSDLHASISSFGQVPLPPPWFPVTLTDVLEHFAAVRLDTFRTNMFSGSPTVRETNWLSSFQTFSSPPGRWNIQPFIFSCKYLAFLVLVLIVSLTNGPDLTSPALLAGVLVSVRGTRRNLVRVGVLGVIPLLLAIAEQQTTPFIQY